MYQLNDDEEKALARWAKDERWVYLKQNKYMFVEETLEDKIVFAKDNIENDVIKKVDEILDQNNKLIEIFETNAKMVELLSNLSEYEERLIHSKIVEDKTDSALAEELNSNVNAIRVRRKRTFDKIREKNNRGDGIV